MFFSDVQHERVLASRILDNCTAKKKKKTRHFGNSNMQHGAIFATYQVWLFAPFGW